MDESILGAVGVGLDIVQISEVVGSLRQFGDAFKNRLFTHDELIYASDEERLCAERLAARFAVKEAVIKALLLSEVGVQWREIEVIKQSDGCCYLKLHGYVAVLAISRGATQWLLSMSHEGDYAGAVVIALGLTPHPLISELALKVKNVGIH
jgi:holo-[acyl-carrier protein] synthase